MKKNEIFIWVERREKYSRLLFIIRKGMITPDYSKPLLEATNEYAKEIRKKYGRTAYTQCQRGTITPHFLEFFCMNGDERKRIDSIMKVLSEKASKEG